MSDLVNKNKPKRDPNTGEILTRPKNFVTTPGKRGGGQNTPGTLLSKFPEYIPDDYDRQRDLQRVSLLPRKHGL